MNFLIKKGLYVIHPQRNSELEYRIRKITILQPLIKYHQLMVYWVMLYQHGYCQELCFLEFPSLYGPTLELNERVICLKLRSQYEAKTINFRDVL